MTHAVRRTGAIGALIELYIVEAKMSLSTLPRFSFFVDLVSKYLRVNTKHAFAAVCSVSRHDAGAEWLPSLFCEMCITTLIKRQWPIYEESLAKATCKVNA